MNDDIINLLCYCTIIYSKQLTHKCRERDGDLYCLRCFDNLESAICGACRRPIEGRIIHALGKMWHPEVMHLLLVKKLC